MNMYDPEVVFLELEKLVLEPGWCCCQLLLGDAFQWFVVGVYDDVVTGEVLVEPARAERYGLQFLLYFRVILFC